MLICLILKVCECTFARNFDKSKLVESYFKKGDKGYIEESSSEYESEEDVVNTEDKLYWIFSKKKDIYMIFSELVDDCFTKKNAPNNFYYKNKRDDLDFKFEIEYNKVSRRKRPEDTIEEPLNSAQTFAYINEEVRFGIAEDAIEKVLKKNIFIRINLVNNPNFNYYRVPLILNNVRKQYLTDELLELYCGDFAFPILFSALFADHFFNLPEEDYKKCISGLTELCSMTRGKFRTKFKDKIFLIVHLNVETIRPLFEYIKKQDRRNVQIWEFFREMEMEIMQPFFKKLRLSEYYTRHDVRRDVGIYQADWCDVFSIRVTYGILTDVLNLLGYYVDNNAKFNFYEAYEFLRTYDGEKEPFFEKFKHKK